MTDHLYAARRLLENPAVLRAFDEMVQDIKDAWATTAPNDTERMQWLRYELATIERLKSKLENWKYDCDQSESSG